MKFTALLFATSVSAVTWNIASNTTSGERENLCSRQIQTCQNNCGGPNEAPMAFCNTNTLAWGCGCLKKTPDFETWNWPVPAADCNGSNKACSANCNTVAGDKRNACFAQCSETHKCNTEDAPVSYTNTDDVDIAPKYVGPAVSYKGDKLADLNDGNNRDGLVASDDDSTAEESESASGSSSSSKGEKDNKDNKDSSTSGASTVKVAGLMLAAAIAATAF
ncbi:hypothetical protein GGI07_005737 [Coemansia sp. Benny D115]|nr:hypothetical protein GGI07_005737 [Coemansia sp. Benny D115]